MAYTFFDTLEPAGPRTPRGGRVPFSLVDEAAMVDAQPGVTTNQSRRTAYNLVKNDSVDRGFDAIPEDDKKLVKDVLNGVLTRLYPKPVGVPQQVHHIDHVEFVMVPPTHYNIILYIKSASFSMGFLASVIHRDFFSDQPQYSGVKVIRDAYIDPKLAIRELTAFEQDASAGPVTHIPALIVEVWNSVESRRQSTIRTDVPDAIAKMSDLSADASSSTGYYAVKEGAALPNGTQSPLTLPTLAVRLLNSQPFEARLNVPGFVNPYCQVQIDALAGLLHNLHHSNPQRNTWDIPVEFSSQALKAESCVIIRALGYEERITLSDMLALYFCDPDAIKEVYYDCACVAVCAQKDFRRGGLSVKLRIQQSSVHNVQLLKSAPERAESLSSRLFSSVVVEHTTTPPLPAAPKQQSTSKANNKRTLGDMANGPVLPVIPLAEQQAPKAVRASADSQMQQQQQQAASTVAVSAASPPAPVPVSAPAPPSTPPSPRSWRMPFGF